jgi:NAD(P)-dependent dehydrogenase (short-subunit alcohol dehydrogenase family)
VHADVSDAESVSALVDAAVSRFGKLDCMVNNAGISGTFRRLMMDDLRDFEKVIKVDLLGVMLGTQAAARVMAPGGSIINTTSIGGIQAGVGFSSYRAAKAGVIHFSRCAAIELAELGLRVNVIAPGNIATKINAAFDTRSVVARMQPLQRLGSPEDVANAAVYLASDRGAQVTGVVLPVDGGTTAGPPPLSADTIMRRNDQAGS